MSKKYRLMIYFAHSTMVLYSKTIQTHMKMTVSEFIEENKDVIKRVFDEGMGIFNYELSHEQMARASYCYLSSLYNPQSVNNTETYILKENKQYENTV